MGKPGGGVPEDPDSAGLGSDGDGVEVGVEVVGAPADAGDCLKYSLPPS